MALPRLLTTFPSTARMATAMANLDAETTIVEQRVFLQYPADICAVL